MSEPTVLRLTAAEADALDRLLDAFLATEEAWHIVPALKRIRLKLQPADQPTPAVVPAGQHETEGR